MGKDITLWKPAKVQAVELFATNTDILGKDVAEMCGVSEVTISRWRNTREFNEAVLERFEGVALSKLPKTIETAIDMAQSGSAAHLKILLQYYGKLVHRVETMHKDESPYEAWKRIKEQGKVNGSIEEAEIVAEEDDDEEVAETNHQIDIRRNEPAPKCNATHDRRRAERTKELRRQRREVSKRAERIGYPKMPPGRWNEAKRKQWFDGLIEAEKRYEQTGEPFTSDSDQ